MSKIEPTVRRLTLKDMNLKEKNSEDQILILEKKLSDKRSQCLREMMKSQKQIRDNNPEINLIDEVRESQACIQQYRDNFLQEQEQKIKQFQDQEFQQSLQNHYKQVVKGLKLNEIFKLKQLVLKRKHVFQEQNQELVEQAKEQKIKLMQQIAAQRKHSKQTHRRTYSNFEMLKCDRTLICQIQCKQEMQWVYSFLAKIKLQLEHQKSSQKVQQIINQEMIDRIENQLNISIQEIIKQQQIQKALEEELKMQQQIIEKEKAEQEIIKQQQIQKALEEELRMQQQIIEREKAEQEIRKLQLEMDRKEQLIKNKINEFKMQDEQIHQQISFSYIEEQSNQGLQQITEQYSMEQSNDTFRQLCEDKAQLENENLLQQNNQNASQNLLKGNKQYQNEDSLQNISIVDNCDENTDQALIKVNYMMQNKTVKKIIQEPVIRTPEKQNENSQIQINGNKENKLIASKSLNRKTFSQEFYNSEFKQSEEIQEQEQKQNLRYKKGVSSSQDLTNNQSLKFQQKFSSKSNFLYDDIINKLSGNSFGECNEETFIIIVEALKFYTQTLTKQQVDNFLRNQAPSTYQISICIGILGLLSGDKNIQISKERD